MCEDCLILFKVGIFWKVSGVLGIFCTETHLKAEAELICCMCYRTVIFSLYLNYELNRIIKSNFPEFKAINYIFKTSRFIGSDAEL